MFEATNSLISAVILLEKKLDALMEHLGLEFDKEPVKDEKIVIKKKEEK